MRRRQRLRLKMKHSASLLGGGKPTTKPVRFRRCYRLDQPLKRRLSRNIALFIKEGVCVGSGDSVGVGTNESVRRSEGNVVRLRC